MSTLFRPFADWLSRPHDRSAGDLSAHWHGAGSDAAAIPVRPLALGESHATIQCFADETLSERGELELTCGEPSLHVRIAARIRMSQASLAPGRIESTLAFDGTLGSEVIQRLAVAGLIERRSYPRFPISLTCEARPVEGPERPLHVHVLDYSASGVRAICGEALPIGTQIFVCAAGENSAAAAAVTLRVVRNVPHEGENLLGCVFDGRSGYFRFKNLVANDEEPVNLARAQDWSWLDARSLGRSPA